MTCRVDEFQDVRKVQAGLLDVWLRQLGERGRCLQRGWLEGESLGSSSFCPERVQFEMLICLQLRGKVRTKES